MSDEELREQLEETVRGLAAEIDRLRETARHCPTCCCYQIALTAA